MSASSSNPDAPVSNTNPSASSASNSLLTKAKLTSHSWVTAASPKIKHKHKVPPLPRMTPRVSSAGVSPMPDTNLVDFLMTARHSKTKTPRSRSMSSSGGKANEVRRAVNRSPGLKRQGFSLPTLRLDGTKYREICNLTTHGFNPFIFRSVVYYGPLLLKTGVKKWRRVFGIVCGNSYMYIVDEDMANKPAKHATTRHPTTKTAFTQPLMQLTILRCVRVPVAQ
ncbi:hypothetical protein SARC_09537 [Sphaeroforma arctica JP610]|uniref:PH domain-containing protein n=1 Tax=Sphaeroforma arctica JP610 TaxID=667725 RepID=A0A0L0FNG3_9EUKA|nr:hypothetical protein SARC_09537 [Sphaeroforma arctica JP610]KNC78016.1 hypothetical protein SARC_09537 [Sphaeroforma arctica JP610]|eukprot:XP_014151918.1 hypothetical protein SARC_09537 [Sphaeroforma arctica JP610]